MNVNYILCECVDRINMAQDQIHWRAVMNTLMYLQVP